MAEVQEEVPGSGGPNRTVFVIMAVIAVAFIVGGLIVGKKKEESKPPTIPPANARALVVPSDDAPRTIVVAPCGTDVQDTARQARTDGEGIPNTLRFRFPRGGGDRALLVPDCSPEAGVSGINPGIPTAAFVLTVGTREHLLQIPPVRSESQLIVPRDSSARTVVVGPCSGVQGGEVGKPVPATAGGQSQDAVLEPEPGQGDLATAPAC